MADPRQKTYSKLLKYGMYREKNQRLAALPLRLDLASRLLARRTHYRLYCRPCRLSLLTRLARRYKLVRANIVFPLFIFLVVRVWDFFVDLACISASRGNDKSRPTHIECFFKIRRRAARQLFRRLAQIHSLVKRNRMHARIVSRTRVSTEKIAQDDYFTFS